MSTNIGEHLQMIRQDPDSDEARFVLADVYEEQGNLDRANFIRLQLERAALPVWDAQRLRLELKERALLAEHEAAWRGELPQLEGVRWGRFERGYPRMLAFDNAAAVTASLTTCIDACPVYGLMLRWPTREQRSQLPEAIEGVRELTIVGTIMETDDMKWLAASPLLSQLHALNLVESEMTGDALVALLASPHLEKLKALRMPIHNFGNTGMEALVSSSLPSLRELDISVATEDELGSGGRYEQTMDADGATLLAAWDGSKQLESLNISGNQIGQRGVEMLLSTPHLAGLKDLRIASIADWDWEGDGKPDVLSPFASADTMTLEVFDVGETDIMAGAEALANSPALVELKILHMSRANQDEQLRVLLEASWFDELRILHSNDGFAILRPILDRKPEKLHTLNLPSKYHWSRPASLAKALAGLEANPTLLQLDLGASGYEPDELEAMGTITALPNLMALRIYESEYDDEPEFSHEAAAIYERLLLILQTSFNGRIRRHRSPADGGPGDHGQPLLQRTASGPVSMATGTVGFCVGTGRCGTTFITKLASLDPDVAASHERLRLPATFHMYCKWHGIDVDAEGFFSDRDAAIAADLRDHKVSFESSALLSHSITELFERYRAKFVLLVRRPDETVASFAARGWFLDPIPWADSRKPPSITEDANPRHFFGRNLPRGDEFARWSALTQIGKLAWFWKARNTAILEQFRQLPPEQCRIVRLEDFDHACWAQTASFLGWQTIVGREQFETLAGSRPNAGPNKPIATAGWSSDSVAEFETEVGSLAGALGYEHRIGELLAGSQALISSAPIVPDVLATLSGEG